MDDLYIGVDVSKAWIDVFDPRGRSVERLANMPAALASWARGLQPVQARCRVIFEATGSYHRDLERALGAAGIACTRVNPRQAREFARATGQLAKTDAVDARLMSAMGRALRPPQTPPPAPNRTRLAALVARRQDLVDTLTAETNRLHVAQDPWVERQIKAAMRSLQGWLKRIDEEIDTHKAQHRELQNIDARLQSAPGVGPKIASVLMAYLPELGTLARRAIASLAGLAPHPCESGIRSSRRRIWGGRAPVRRALYMAALVAARHNPHWRAVYTTMRDKGKAAKTALIAIARRILVRLNAMIANKTEYATQ